jgi:hypothetical protein
MHIELPNSSAEERRTFERLASWLDDETSPILYQHKKPEMSQENAPSGSVWNRVAALLKKWMS